ncbi:PREDICTED: 5'-nucleotidase domain-containing protein 1 [Vollenhovia emeryi]|uniref:5'-nucleotidase domain-containing protein 1 n=1 Tax=Vollenhovia emeryi TaxID=411798 RepID=UPI0005F5463C|nr:PREDICTED: 5'-nucleotidase domain-containing protein 1 [Vollenhovia emeryi]
MLKDLGLRRSNVLRLCARSRVADEAKVFSGTSVRAALNSRHGSTASRGFAENDMASHWFKFGDYGCVGFDLDNTLLRYNVTNLVHMEYEVLSRFLVDERGYSGKRLLKPLTDYELDFMQKGLLLDCERGNVLKVGADRVIHRACHGTRLLTAAEIEETYPSRRSDVTDAFCRDPMSLWNGPLSQKLRSLLDYFDIVASVAFARAVDTLDEEKGSPLGRYEVWPDVLAGLVAMFSREHFQTDQGVFGHIKRNPGKYLRKCSPDTISWLRELKKRSATFLLTGSNADFADFTASYALGEDWRSLFDIAVCYAKKPGFFIQTRPFLDVVNNNETDTVSKELRRGEMYSQGNWVELLEFLARVNQPVDGETNRRCLYVGDNLLQDIYVPNVYAHFDTLAVIEEQMSEEKPCRLLTDSDRQILNSKLWGSYFRIRDLSIDVDTLWGHIIMQHAKLSIPDISFVTRIPLDERISCFDGKLYDGYYPNKPYCVIPHTR